MKAVLKIGGVESWGMQGFRRAFVITGLVILGLGSNLAWHYPRPEALGLKLTSPPAVMASTQTLQAAGVRCHASPDWSDLVVESVDREQAQEALKNVPQLPHPPRAQKWETPPALLADLAQLAGVKEANVVIQDGRQAVVMLSMQHGAFAGDRQLMQQALGTVRSHRPSIKAENIKLLDGKGADLNYSSISYSSGKVHPLQRELQSQLDALLGERQALFFCHLKCAQGQKIHLLSVLYLQTLTDEESKAAQELVAKSLRDWLEKQNKLLKTDAAWQVQAVIYPLLGETSYATIQRNWTLDRDNGLFLDQAEIKDWTFTQRTLPLEEVKALQWGLTCPPPTPGQLALGLTALAPALFGWCLLLPWLWRRHQLSPSASTTL